MLGAPPRSSGTCGYITSSLPGFNHHHNMVLSEILMVPRHLYPSVSTLGHRNGRAAIVDNRSPLQLALVHPRAPNRHPVMHV